MAVLRRNHVPQYGVGACCHSPAHDLSFNSTMLMLVGEPALTALCHCHACQKWCGAAASSNVIVPRDHFKLLRGTPSVYKQPGDSGKLNARHFCGNCGSCLFGELEIMPDVFGIKAG